MIPDNSNVANETVNVISNSESDKLLEMPTSFN